MTLLPQIKRLSEIFGSFDQDPLSQKSQEKPIRNTNRIGALNQYYCWCFTIPEEEYTASQLSQDLRVYAKKFVFSLESGDKTGYRHWQGIFSLRQKAYFVTVKNLLCDTAHLEPKRMSWACNVNYCSKSDTHLEGPYSERTEFLILPDILYDWQQRVVDICLTKPNDRTIHWFWDPLGCKGKTMLCKKLYAHYDADCLNNAGLRDIAFSLSDHPKIICFNLTRSNEERINYGAIEACKDGFIFSAKYESKMKVFNSPHVFVFANYEPNQAMLSKDRWHIFRIL